MRRIIISIFLLSIILTSCEGQNNENNTANNLNIKPKTDIKVNKEYDDNGNLIRYDSTYTYYYSNIKNDSLLEDSIFNNFKKLFNSEFNFSSDPFFNDFFLQDSLLNNDFYNNDFFIERYRNNPRQIDELFKKMDSLKNQFFKQQFTNSNKPKIKI